MKLENLPIARLRRAEYNPRRISKKARENLKRSLETFGLVDPIIVNERTGYTVVGGHQRLSILEELGETTAACVVLDIEPDRERLLNVALNNRKLSGEYDFAKTADLLLELDAANIDTSIAGFEPFEIQAMSDWAPYEGKKSVVEKCPTCGSPIARED